MSCSICHQLFDENQVLLPCLHGFCFKCFSGPKCTICDKPHEGKVIPLINFFPIPSIRVVLKSLGLTHLTLSKVENFVVIDRERCCECHHYGTPFHCLELETNQIVFRNLCSQCSRICYDPHTDRIEGDAEILFEKIEKKSIKLECPSNFLLIKAFFGKDYDNSVAVIRKLFSGVNANVLISEESCERLLKTVQDCQPDNYSPKKNGAMNQIMRIVAPHCLRWHKISSFQYILKQFMQSAFGSTFDGDNRKINPTLAVWFIYCMRNRTMYQFDWINTQYPDNSYYIYQAILQK